MPSKPDSSRNARQRALRERRRNDAFRVATLYLTPATHANLTLLSEKWGLPMAGVIARLCDEELRYMGIAKDTDENA